MTPFASTALFKRNGQSTFFPPRKEISAPATQARKSASRHWNNRMGENDRLSKIILVQCTGQLIYVAERSYTANGPARNWVEYHISHADALAQGHLAACLKELGVDPSRAPAPMPDTLEINGVIYRREI